jgi:hypothetical protein
MYFFSWQGVHAPGLGPCHEPEVVQCPGQDLGQEHAGMSYSCQ